MITGVSGSLISRHYAEHLLATAFAGRLGEESREKARRALRAWWRHQGHALGPAASLRALFDLGASPVLALLGFAVHHPRVAASGDLLVAEAKSGPTTIPLLVAPWGEPMDHL